MPDAITGHTASGVRVRPAWRCPALLVATPTASRCGAPPGGPPPDRLRVAAGDGVEPGADAKSRADPRAGRGARPQRRVPPKGRLRLRRGPADDHVPRVKIGLAAAHWCWC